MRDLKDYRRRRDPARTPEPFGEERPGRALPRTAARRFVVQQHAARNLHWDLRLEVDGALVSWAVPRGPSLDPAQKRLAVRTEDHPLEYAHFEGVIPRGNYGAGAMIVWDSGSYRLIDGSAPRDGLERGKLDLLLEGHKLRGRFALVRTKGEPAGRSWLLLRKDPNPDEGRELVDTEPRSVLSGLTVAELREGVRRDAEVAAAARAAGAPQAETPARELRPMLAASQDEPFSREGWLFELKYDGVRLLASRQREGSVHLRTRTGADRTALYPEVARALSHLPLERFVIDGEAVALDERGRSSFERLQRRFTQSDPQAAERLEVEIPVVFFVFDVLAAAGHDLRRVPLKTRKAILARFVPRIGVVRFADHVETDGRALFEAAEAHGLEGVVAKQVDSPYETGRRSRRWLKIKVPRSACFAVVGWVPGKGSRGRLGSLMLAWQRDGALRYAGSVGSGLSEERIDAILPSLMDRERAEPAVTGVPDPAPRGARWVDPALVCEARFSEVTRAGMLRHPVFVGLRGDRTPDDCWAPDAGERTLADPGPASAPAPPRLELVRLDKVFWPVEGYTKGDLIEYYRAVWPWLSPYLRDRPLVLVRYPDGVEGKHFYQKNAPEFTPDWVEREQIDGTDYFICNELRSLLYVINSGAIPLHVWSARRDAIDRPDWLILDLDPKQAPFAHVVRVARHIHQLLGSLDVPHYVKTSGQAGLHVMLPLGAALDHADARALAEVLARAVCSDLSELATVARPLAARGDKVYVDFLQNGYGKLIAAPYSVRPRPHAPVSTPLTWGQVTAKLDPSRWTIRSVPRRLRSQGDPLAGLLTGALDVERLLEALGSRLE